MALATGPDEDFWRCFRLALPGARAGRSVAARGVSWFRWEGNHWADFAAKELVRRDAALAALAESLAAGAERQHRRALQCIVDVNIFALTGAQVAGTHRTRQPRAVRNGPALRRRSMSSMQLRMLVALWRAVWSRGCAGRPTSLW